MQFSENKIPLILALIGALGATGVQAGNGSFEAHSTARAHSPFHTVLQTADDFYAAQRVKTNHSGKSFDQIADDQPDRSKPDGKPLLDGAPDRAHGLPASISAVPEPETWAMMLVGLGLIGRMVRRNGAGSTRMG